MASSIIRPKADKIPAFIASYKDCPIPLTLVCPYKGLLLSQDIDLLSGIPDQVVLQAPQNRLLITLTDSIYLYSRDLSETFIAQVQEVEEGRIILAKLSATGRPWKERIYERVQPGSFIYADVTMNERSIRACIEEISGTGMRLSAYKPSEKNVSPHADATGVLHFRLPGDALAMKMAATVVHFTQHENLVVAGVRISPSSSQADHLQKYVAARKHEILQELDQKCAATYDSLAS